MNTTVARAIALAANQMSRGATVDDTLEVIVRSATEALPTFDHIGISTVEQRGEIITRASTSALVLELDDLQYSLSEGRASRAWRVTTSWTRRGSRTTVAGRTTSPRP